MGLVYSSEKGRVCPKCGWPAERRANAGVRSCQCSSSRSGAAAPIPARVVAKLRMEKKGRGGKTVTVVYGLPENDAFRKELCQELKRGCGTGGAVNDEGVEIQGDQRDRVRALLLEKGWTIKG